MKNCKNSISWLSNPAQEPIVPIPTLLLDRASLEEMESITPAAMSRMQCQVAVLREPQ